MNARHAEHARLLAEQAQSRSGSVQATPAQNTDKPVKNADSGREAVLLRFTSRLPRHEVAAVYEVAIETMLNVPQWSESSDRHGLGYLLRFAAWVHRNEGYFDPATQMDDARIETWVAQAYSNVRESTAQTAYDALLRIRDSRQRRGPKRRSSRPFARAPHTATEWAHYQAAAASLRSQPIGQSVQMLLDLTGEIGLRADEVIRADGAWIEIRNGLVSVSACNHLGAVREIHVDGKVAERLAPLAGTADLLVMPNMLKTRHNVIDSTLRQANRHSYDSMSGFSATRARHKWLVRLMQQPITFAALATVADINPGSHLLTDLLSYLPAVDPREAAAIVRRHTGGQR